MSPKGKGKGGRLAFFEVEEALTILRFSSRPIAKDVEKTLRSAVSNGVEKVPILESLSLSAGACDSDC